jgi:hypothetical protein
MNLEYCEAISTHTLQLEPILKHHLGSNNSITSTSSRSPSPQLFTLAMTYHGQLLREESYIQMPFLLEYLPFLNLFDGPEVSVYEVLAILANPS